MEHRTKTEDDIKRAEQHEALKQTLLRLLEDPQVQQKLVTPLHRRLEADLRGKEPLRQAHLIATINGG
jgi:hypothetical protein